MTLPRLLDGGLDRVTVLADGRFVVDGPAPPACLPGSFNPLHAAHLELAATAAEMLGSAVPFELSVDNVDKPALTRGEVERRLAQFAGRATVELTRAPTFAAKARILPGAVFVVGADTAERLVDPRYYGGSAAVMAERLAGLWARGNRFLVAGRRGPDGRFRTFDDIAVPTEWRRYFTPIPEARFRLDLSSTDLRGD